MQDGQIVIPLAILLIPYLLFVLFYLLYCGLNLHNLVRYGIGSRLLWNIIIVFSVGSLGLLIASMALMASFDWHQALSLQELFSGPATL
ncbi:hypothetical protein HYV73_03920 [Candidatus Uhrbacteria bacterium]|nr:hypothetical protein [Candidatus Uhrbacteria bacterium]